MTPGLVDLHTHTWHGATYWGLDPEPVAWRTGVTTWVDAGSAGAYSLDAFRRFVIDTAAVRIPALLNVSALGLIAESGEHHDLEHLDVDLAGRVAARHADAIYGVKARIDARTVGAHGIEPLRRAAALARRIHRPLMVHVGYGPPPYLRDIVPLLDAGDILTHCASGYTSDMLATTGELSNPARRALDVGVTFDSGHGSGAFAFDVLDAQLAAGLDPTVSSDLHVRSFHGPAFDLPTVMAKPLALGVPLPRVIEAATVRPARALGLPDGVGRLTEGGVADIAVFDLEDGRFPVVDVHGSVRHAPQRLTNVATYVAGRPLPPRSAQPPPPWVALSPAQRGAADRRLMEIRTAHSPRLADADSFPTPYPRNPSDPPDHADHPDLLDPHAKG